MRLEYTLSLADYKAAQRLHIRRRPFRRLTYLFWYVVIPALAVIGMVAFLAMDLHKLIPQWAPALFGLETCLVWFAVFLPIARFYALRKGFKQIFPAGRTERESSIDIDEERIISAIPGVSEGKFYWGAIVDWAQDNSITLLYIGPKRFLFVPTRAFSDEQRLELCELLARKGLKG